MAIYDLIGLRSAMVKSASQGNNPYAGTLYEDAQPWERPDYNPGAALQEEARRGTAQALQAGQNWSQGQGQQYQGPAQGVAGRVGEFAGTAYNSYLKPVGQAVAGAGKQYADDVAALGRSVANGVSDPAAVGKAVANGAANTARSAYNVTDAILGPVGLPVASALSRGVGHAANAAGNVATYAGQAFQQPALQQAGQSAKNFAQGRFDNADRKTQELADRARTGNFVPQYPYTTAQAQNPTSNQMTQAESDYIRNQWKSLNGSSNTSNAAYSAWGKQ